MSAADTERVFKNQDDLLLLDAEAAAELVTQDEAADPGEDIALDEADESQELTEPSEATEVDEVFEAVEPGEATASDKEPADASGDPDSRPEDYLDIEPDDEAGEIPDADDVVEDDALVEQAPPLSPIAIVALTATVIVLLVTIGIEIYGLASININNAHQAAELENSNDSYLDVKALESDPNVDKD